ncbi:MAG: hypothetical protein ACKVHR_10865 [Pirellulales bacterium]
MRFQHAVVFGLGWLLPIVVGCTSGESKRISGLSSFVPSFTFDTASETSEVAERLAVSGSPIDKPEENAGTPFQAILSKLPWKRSAVSHGPDLMVPLTDKEKAEIAFPDRRRAASLKSRIRIGKARLQKSHEFRAIDAELDGLYSNKQGSTAQGLDLLLADADAMAALELDAFAAESAAAEMIVLRAIPDVRAFQQPVPKSPASLSLIQPRDRSLKVKDDVAIRALPYVPDGQKAQFIKPTHGLPASSLSWRERLQKSPVTQDQRSSSFVTVIQPRQTELRVLRMTAVTPEDRSVYIAPQVSIRSIGSPTVVRGVHPDALHTNHQPTAVVADQVQSGRRDHSTSQHSLDKTLNR